MSLRHILSMILGGIVLAAGSARLLAQDGQRPEAFTASADLVQVDVQVLDATGRPVEGLGPDAFAVTIGGRRRPVRVVEMVRAASQTDVTPDAAGPAPGLRAPRVLIVAIDALTFGTGPSRGVAAATRRFIEALPPGDYVGLFTYPTGPRVDPTTDYAAVVRALDALAGQRQAGFRSQFALRESDVVDYTASPQGRDELIERHCGATKDTLPLVTGRAPDGQSEARDDPFAADAEDNAGSLNPNCVVQLEQEVQGMATYLETQARTSLTMLRDLLARMAAIPGRKVLTLVSAGTPVSDRAGGRPDIGSLPDELGQVAAQANTAIYTLFVDESFLEQFSSDTRRATRSRTSGDRDSQLLSRWLAEFSSTAGGTLIPVLVGSGDGAFAQVARETAVYYVLGVDLADTDRSDRPQRIEVQVNRPSVTVRSREWVLAPRTQ